MKSRRVSKAVIAGCALLLAAAVSVLVWQRLENARAGRERAQREQVEEAARAQREADRLAQAERDEAQVRARRALEAVNPAPTPPAPPRANERPRTAPAVSAPAAVELLPGFTGPQQWRDLGTGTGSAALETHCWAIDHLDPDVLMRTIELTPASRARIETIFARLSPAEQREYGSAERMFAMVWARNPLPFPGMKIISEHVRGPDEVGVVLQLQYGSEPHDREFVFRRHPDGWRKVTPDSQVESFLRRAGLVR